MNNTLLTISVILLVIGYINFRIKRLGKKGGNSGVITYNSASKPSDLLVQEYSQDVLGNQVNDDNEVRKIVNQLNRKIISIESYRIVAEKSGNIQKTEEFNNKRMECEKIRDKISNGNFDDDIIKEAMKILNENV